MLKHSDLISKMTTHQKLTILTDFYNLANLDIPDEYKFLGQKVSLNGLHFNGNVLPSIGSISSSFNEELMYEYSSFLGYVASQNNYKFIVSPSINIFNHRDLISKEPFLNYKTLKSFTRGLHDNSVIPLLNYFDNDNDIKTDDVIHLNEYLQCVLSIQNIKYPYLYFDNKTSKLKSNNIIPFIQKSSYNKLYMNKVPYDNQPRNTVSFSNSNVNGVNDNKYDVDILLDELLDYLLKDDHYREKYDYNKIINNLLIESTCLLKNKDYVLPLKDKHKICFITNSNISDSDIKEIDENIIINKFNKLPSSVKDFDTILIHVDNKDSLAYLNKEMHHIKSYHNNGIKIIVCLTLNDVINTSFDKDIDVLIKTINLNKTNIKSFIDILLGNKCPCGKLNISYPVDNYNFVGNELLTENNTKYPFGYSLNYGSLTYSDFVIDKNSISFVVSNKTKTNLSDVIQIYMENQRWLGEKHLIHYKKVYLKPGESSKVNIVLTKSLFSRYSINSSYYRIKKGLYRVYVNNSLTNTLKDILYIIDIDKSTLNGKSFKMNALVALEPRYVGKKVDYPYKSLVIVISFIVLLTCLINLLVSNNLLSYILFFLSLVFVVVARFLKVKPSNVIKNDLDSHFKVDDVIQFEDFYKEDEILPTIYKEDNIKFKKEVKKDNFYYVKDIQDFIDMQNDMYEFFLCNGLSIERKSFDNLCACEFTSRVNYVKCVNQEGLKHGINLLNKFLNNKEFDSSNLKETIEIAKKYPHHMFVTYLEKIDDNITNINNDCKFNTVKYSVNIDGENIELSKNIWYVIPSTEFKIDNFDFNCNIAELNFVLTDKKEYDKPLYQLYFDTFHHFLLDLSDNYVIEENYYKKFDDFIQCFKGMSDYRYLNKVVTTIEMFAALSLAVKNDTPATIDNIFANKLLYFVLRQNKRHLNGQMSLDFIKNSLIQIYGESNMKETIKVINDLDVGDLLC